MNNAPIDVETVETICRRAAAGPEGRLVLVVSPDDTITRVYLDATAKAADSLLAVVSPKGSTFESYAQRVAATLQKARISLSRLAFSDEWGALSLREGYGEGNEIQKSKGGKNDNRS